MITKMCSIWIIIKIIIWKDNISIMIIIFIVYDNFGQMINYVGKSHWDIKFRELNNYLISSNKYGGGVKYADVFASADKDILRSILSLEKYIESKDYDVRSI